MRNQVRDKLDLDFEDRGELEVKNIARPIRAFDIILNDKARRLIASFSKRLQGRNKRRFLRPAAIAIVVAALGVIAVLRPWAPDFEPVPPEAMAQPLPAKPSIAVLPFDDLSSGDDKDYLSDAIAEGILTELSRFSELFVIARNSSFQYRDKASDVCEIARELGVRYVLEGSQQKADQALRVTVQLIDAVAGNHIWAERYDRELKDLFTVQDEIVRAIVPAVGAKILDDASRKVREADPVRLRAFEAWLKGIHHFRKYTKEDTELSRLANLAAIEADPLLPEGHTGLAWVYLRGASWGWTDLDREEALQKARHHAQIALDLAPNDYRPHFTMAYVHTTAGELDAAITWFKQSLELNPNAASVMANYSEPLIYAGRYQEAIELLNKAMRLDPHHPDWFKWWLGFAQLYAGECEQALGNMRAMTRLPTMARRTTAAIYVCLGEEEKAREEIAKLLEKEPDYSIAKLRLGMSGKFKNPADLERWVQDLRTAGLPE